MLTVEEWVEPWAGRAPVIPVDVLRELLDSSGDGAEDEEP
jgi:hypothetical protein